MKNDLKHTEHEMSVMEIHTTASFPKASFPPEFFADIQNDYRGASPYHVNYCGHEKCRPGHKAGPFVRTSFLVHVVLAGSGVYKYRGRDLEISGGQAFLIFPQDTTTYIADREDPWEYGWIGFSGYRIPGILDHIGFSEENPVIDVSNADVLLSIIFRMMDSPRMTLSDELVRTAELLRFFGLMIEGREAEHPASHIYSKETYAQVALRYLNDNYMENIRIADLAAVIGVDRSYLSRVFFNEYHQSPQQYLLKVRLDNACRLLRDTGMTIGEIAEAVGYGDARSFTKIFRQKQGVSPSEYRTASLSGSGQG